LDERWRKRRHEQMSENGFAERTQTAGKRKRKRRGEDRRRAKKRRRNRKKSTPAGVKSVKRKKKLRKRSTGGGDGTIEGGGTQTNGGGTTEQTEDERTRGKHGGGGTKREMLRFEDPSLRRDRPRGRESSTVQNIRRGGGKGLDGRQTVTGGGFRDRRVPREIVV
jgi:hypothetical protein